MDFDHQLSLNKIRDFLRRNDFNGYVLEILQFASHPIKNRSDENAKLILEFNSLVLTEERRVIYNDYFHLLDKNLRWVKDYFVEHIVGKDYESKLTDLTEKLAKVVLNKYPHITIASKKVEKLLSWENTLVRSQCYSSSIKFYDPEEVLDHNEGYSKLYDGRRVLHPLNYSLLFYFSKVGVDFIIKNKASEEDTSMIPGLGLDPELFRDDCYYTLFPEQLLNDEFILPTYEDLILEKWEEILSEWEISRVSRLDYFIAQLQNTRNFAWRGPNGH